MWKSGNQESGTGGLMELSYPGEEFYLELWKVGNDQERKRTWSDRSRVPAFQIKKCRLMAGS
jgi:hypothetical protein